MGGGIFIGTYYHTRCTITTVPGSASAPVITNWSKVAPDYFIDFLDRLENYWYYTSNEEHQLYIRYSHPHCRH